MNLYLVKNGWTQQDVPNLPFAEGTTAWYKGSLNLLFSPKEEHSEDDLGGGFWKHASISHPLRYPTWNEILDARYTFFDENDTVCQILPPKNQYVNVHNNCFHLWSPIRNKLAEAVQE